MLACVELMPYSSGLTRNIVQCLQDYGIPLYLTHTVTSIRGHDRVEQVTVSRVDEQRMPIPGTEMVFDCDTLLLSVGLIPENELSRQAGICMDPRTGGAVVYENMETTVPGIFACGNVVHVHDLVDFVYGGKQSGGRAAALFAQNGQAERTTLFRGEKRKRASATPCRSRSASRCETWRRCFFRVNRVLGASRIVVIEVSPQGRSALQLQYRREHMAPGEMESIVLPAALLQKIRQGQLTLLRQKEARGEMKELDLHCMPQGLPPESGRGKRLCCHRKFLPQGSGIWKKGAVNPTRVITSTVKVEGGALRRVSVKTSAPIPKGMLFEVMRTLDNVQLTAPVAAGQVVVPNVLGTGAVNSHPRSMGKQAE